MSSVAVFDALGQALRASGDINQALSTYAKLAAAQPRSPIPHTRAAEIYVDRKDTEAAIGSLRKALAIRPDLVEPLRMLIKLNVLSGRQQEALSIARDQQKSRPNNPFGYQMAGEILASQRSYLEAAEVYRSGIMFTGGPELATGLHGVLLAGGKGTEADKFASDWMRDHPKDRRFAHYMAEAAIVRGNFQDALKRNLELLKTEPDNPIVLNNTAFLAGRLKQPGALEYAEKANKIATNEPKFMDTLAELLADSGDVARALELSSKASRATPQNFGIKFSYARILLKAGKTAEAKKELEDLAKLGDKFAAQEEVAKLLKAL